MNAIDFMHNSIKEATQSEIAISQGCNCPLLATEIKWLLSAFRSNVVQVRVARFLCNLETQTSAVSRCPENIVTPFAPSVL